ncbi:hypothetical protein BPIT_35480 [Candidatus Brocadia pituitae]|nr:hypothetical protein BPIT_35480 [Candidatus Brocadia pituitae]
MRNISCSLTKNNPAIFQCIVILFLILLLNTPLLPSLRADQLSAIKPSSDNSMLQSVTCHTGYLEFGLLYFKTKQYNQAINTFEKILVLEPNNFDAHYYLGEGET